MAEPHRVSIAADPTDHRRTVATCTHRDHPGAPIADGYCRASVITAAVWHEWYPHTDPGDPTFTPAARRITTQR